MNIGMTSALEYLYEYVFYQKRSFGLYKVD